MTLNNNLQTRVTYSVVEDHHLKASTKQKISQIIPIKTPVIIQTNKLNLNPQIKTKLITLKLLQSALPKNQTKGIRFSYLRLSRSMIIDKFLVKEFNTNHQICNLEKTIQHLQRSKHSFRLHTHQKELQTIKLNFQVQCSVVKVPQDQLEYIKSILP